MAGWGFLFELAEYVYFSIHLMYNILIWLWIIRPTLAHGNLLWCYFGEYEVYHFLESSDTFQCNRVLKEMMNIQHESKLTRLNINFYVGLLNAKILSFLKSGFSLIPFLVQALDYWFSLYPGHVLNSQIVSLHVRIVSILLSVHCNRAYLLQYLFNIIPSCWN